MATTTITLDTAFVPAVGVFRVQCTEGDSFILFSRGSSSEAWVNIGSLGGNSVSLLDNPIAGVEYKIAQVGRPGFTPTLKMDQ